MPDCHQRVIDRLGASGLGDVALLDQDELRLFVVVAHRQQGERYRHMGAVSPDLDDLALPARARAAGVVEALLQDQSRFRGRDRQQAGLCKVRFAPPEDRA